MNEYFELGKVAIGGLLAANPLTKLIEVTSAAIGTAYKPKALRNAAESKAYEIIKTAEAESKAALIKFDNETELVNRARQRLFQQEIARQNNLENILDKTADQLSESVSDVPVDADWRTRFFNKAQDINTEELQIVWAKILATEVSQPGNISLRTLDILSSLSKQEAELFSKLSSIATNEGYIIKINDNDLSAYGFSYGQLLILKAAGLLSQVDELNTTFYRVTSYSNGVIVEDGLPKIVIMYRNTFLYVSRENIENLKMGTFSLTPSGVELLNIIGSVNNVNYITDLSNKLLREGYVVDFSPQ